VEEALDEEDASLIAKLETLSGIARIAPLVFSEHACQVVGFLASVITL